MWWELVNRVYGRICNLFDRFKIVGGSLGGEGVIIGVVGLVFGVGLGKNLIYNYVISDFFFLFFF